MKVRRVEGRGVCFEFGMIWMGVCHDFLSSDGVGREDKYVRRGGAWCGAVVCIG